MRVPASTCLGCGCTCDDIVLTVDDGRIVQAEHACPLGVHWFGDGSLPDRPCVHGNQASMAAAVEAASSVLRAARAPLVYLGPDLTCETQRGGVAIADLLRGSIEGVASATMLDAVLAAQAYGRATATLGEIKNRADLLLFHGVDPAERYPRYATRYAPDASGLYVPDGRRSRTVVSVDVGEYRGPDDADARYTVPVEDEVAWLTTLTAGEGELVRAMSSARYVVIVADAEAQSDRDPGRFEALIGLTRAMNARTRCALGLLRGGGNRAGADACLTWQTGYPTGVDFSLGHPRYRPGTRVRADALLLLGRAPSVADDVLAVVPPHRRVVIGPAASAVPYSTAVAIDTGVPGIHEAGTVLRMDDVPLPVRAVTSGPPAAASVVRLLRERLLEYARA